MRDRLAEVSFSGVVPVFPLPETVFFPGAVLPLHVFEPRYLAMVADARAGEGLLAVATLLPGWEEEAAGAPRFHPLATVGRMASLTRLPDGRFDLRLAGLERVRLEEEYTSLPYRRAHARVEPDAPVDEHDPEVVDVKGRLLAAYTYLAHVVGASGRPWVAPVERLSFESTVHTLCQALDLPLRDKLMALEAPGPWERLPFARRALAGSLERALRARGLRGIRPAGFERN